jgi:hypothetical protein
MRRAICSVCGRSVAIAQGGLRAHKTFGLYDRSSYPRKAEREQARAATWCYGGARQLALPL